MELLSVQVLENIFKYLPRLELYIFNSFNCLYIDQVLACYIPLDTLFYDSILKFIPLGEWYSFEFKSIFSISILSHAPILEVKEYDLYAKSDASDALFTSVKSTFITTLQMHLHKCLNLKGADILIGKKNAVIVRSDSCDLIDERYQPYLHVDFHKRVFKKDFLTMNKHSPRAIAHISSAGCYVKGSESALNLLANVEDCRYDSCIIV